MSLGNRLYELRKKKNISQEEAAEKLGVTRQTISKWETDQSLPDFDKILPLCELYEISTDELLTGKKSETKMESKSNEEQELESGQRKKTALVVSLSVFIYFIAVIWIIIAEPIEAISDNLMIGSFLFIVAIATVVLVFYFISISKEENKEKKRKEKEMEKYDGLIALIFTCIYLLLSFLTSAWHITWILWIVYAIVIEIVHLLIGMKENKNEGE